MGDAKDEAKRQKKELKAEEKRHKKFDNVGGDAAVPSPTSTVNVPPGPTPAERSAAAAERQVKLQKVRVLIALVAALIALAAFLVTVKPWQYLGPRAQPDGGTSSTSPSASE